MTPFSQRLRAGGALGSWCSFASFSAVEAMAQLPVDFLVMDLQHSEFTQGDFPSMFGAFELGGPTPVERAARNDYHLINWLFDQGAPAVLVPMVNSAAEARQAVEAAKFPPLGRRSFGPVRAARYLNDLAGYMRQADELATIIIQIEEAHAAADIGQIIAVPGIDAVFMGPNDLAFSLLKPGERPAGDPAQWSAFARTPQVMGLCKLVLEACKAAGIPFGTTTGSRAEAREWLEIGASFATLGSDFQFLRAGARQILEA
jgi:2-keto-3-deoxy-L-rhamnonate aldolase RhmA